MTATVLYDDFTAADATTLSSPYTPSTVGAGSDLAIYSNKLRFRTTVGAYGGQARFLTGLSNFADTSRRGITPSRRISWSP